MILTFIINLKKDIERKQYVLDLLKPYEDLLTSKVIDAVEGKLLSQEDLNKQFDVSYAYRRYGHFLNAGEIGCTLSHFKCYRELVNSEDNFACIFEDDITLMHNLNILDSLRSCVDVEKPVILLLSGDYWYNKRYRDGNPSVMSVYDAVGSYAYLINKAAAKCILQKNPRACNVADSWAYYKSLGINIYAVYPYVVDANIENFKSSIEQTVFGENRRNMSLILMLKAYWLALNKKILLKRGHFVSKIRK